MTAGAPAAKACPKPDEQTGNAHYGKRACWSKERSTIPKQKTQRSPANQAEQEQESPFLVGRSWNEKSTENPGDTGIFPLSTVATRLANPIRIPPISACQREWSISYLRDEDSNPSVRLSTYFVSAGGAAGKSELNMSVATFHFPSDCFFQTSQYLPLSLAPSFIVKS